MPTQVERLLATGIRRVGTPSRGFRYRDPSGKKIDASALDRIRALKIPPAWTDVAIHRSASANLQAVGKDRRGRWQYRYHPDFLQKNQDRKYQRLIQFAHSLPKLRARVERDLRGSGLTRDRVMACILRILSCCFLRPGSQVYAKENGSVGIATLRRKHVTVSGDTVRFDFPGKSGKRQVRELQDRRVARIVRELLRAPGQEVFKYQDQTGAWIDVRRRDINAFIKEVMGEGYSAKDFRTWAGTLICACALAREAPRIEAAPSGADRKKRIVAAVKQTAEHLGNTPAICRSSYIYPSVLSSFQRGQVLAQSFQSLDELIHHRGRGLHRSEKALMALLRSTDKACA